LFFSAFSFKDSLRVKLLSILFFSLASLIFIYPVDFNSLPTGDLGIYIKNSIIDYAWNEGPWRSEPVVRFLMIPSELFQNANLFLFNSFLLILFSYYLISRNISEHLHLPASFILLCLVCDRSLFTYESFWVLRQFISTPFIVLACLNFGKKRHLLYLIIAFLAHNSSIIFFALFLFTKLALGALKKIPRVLNTLKISIRNYLKRVIVFIFSLAVVFLLGYFLYTNKIYNLAANFTGDTLDSGLKTIILIFGIASFSIFKIIESLLSREQSPEDQYLFKIACIFFIPSLSYLFFAFGFGGAVGLLAYRISWFIYPLSGLVKLLGIYALLNLLSLWSARSTLKMSLTLTVALVLIRFSAHIQSIPIYFEPLKAFYKSTII
tara:strand:+ start:10526 stop:11662 length:1137 start_codon:yes stop_codon:yes gene_type:complete